MPVMAAGGSRSRSRDDWPVVLVASATLLNGLFNLAKAFVIRVSDNPSLLTVPLPFGVYHTGRVLSLFIGFLLIYLSIHLYSRHRAAWWFALGGLSLAVIAHVGHGHHLFLAAIPAAVIALLVFFRRFFTVRSEPEDITRGLLFVGLSLLIAFAYGTLGFWWLDRREFGINFNWGSAVVRTLRAYLLIGNADLTPLTNHARWFLDSLSVVGSSAIGFAVYSLFRPLAFRFSTLPHERARAAELLQEFGRAPEQYFSLWPDKSYFFAPDGNGYIAYHVASGAALALADPVAAEASMPGLARDFLGFCRDNGWRAAFLYVLPDQLPLYGRLGMRSLKIGADAIVNLERFCTETAQSKQFRRVKRRLLEDGFSTERFLPPHPKALLDQLEGVSREWLTLPGKRERSFALGQFSHDYLQQTPVFAVLGPERRVEAFVNEVPTYRPGQATIDLMRHRVDLPHGVMDYLFSDLFFRLRAEGFAEFDLGLAPMAGVGEHPEATIEERIVRQVFELLSRFFEFQGLREYKAKFEPDWADRFLVYQGGPAALPRIALAMSRILA